MSCGDSGDTEKPLVRSALAITRTRRTRSSAASCSEGPSPWARQPRCSRTPPARSRTVRAGESFDIGHEEYPRRRPSTHTGHPMGVRRFTGPGHRIVGMSSRDVLPIPDRQHVGLDDLRREGSGHVVPADRAAAAAGRRAQRARGAARRRRLRLLVGLRRPVPDTGLRAPGEQRAALQPLPHHGAVLADAPGAADRAQPPRGRHGRDHRDRHLGAGLQLAAPQHGGAARRDPEAQRLLHGAVRQVPRGAGVADEPDGTVRELAVRRRRLRALLRLHRRGDEPVRAGDLRRHDPGRARSHAGGGLPLHRGHDRSGDRLGPPAEGADARQAVLRLLRARRDARAPPRPAGVVGQVQGPLRRRLGRAARGDARPPEGARGGPRGRRAHGAPRRDPGVGRHARRPQAGAGPPDGGLRRLHGAHRPSRRPARSTRSPSSRSSTTPSCT